MKEEERHLEAFELYYSMKDKRSYSRVSKELGLHVRTVQKWGKMYSWVKRVSERDQTIGEGVAEEVIKREIDVKAKIHEALYKTTEKYTELLGKNGISIGTVKDLEILARVYRELEGVGVGVDEVNTSSNVGRIVWDSKGMTKAELIERKNAAVRENQGCDVDEEA